VLPRLGHFSDFVTDVYPEIVFVTWNAINQEVHSRHAKFPEMSKLTCVDLSRGAGQMPRTPALLARSRYQEADLA
jgi:hypothetical protein